nr:speckle-type POZ protein B-like [Parasteatoda tepidariorum]
MAEAAKNTVCLETNNITRIIKIVNFSNTKPGDKIKDQDISHKCIFVKLLQIRVYPAGKSQHKGYVSVMIRRHWIPEYPLSFHCTVNIIDEFGELRLPASFGHRSRGERSVEDIGLEKYISRFELLNDTSGLLPNNTLTLHCEVSYTIESAKEPMAESLWNMINLLCEMFPQREDRDVPNQVKKWTFLIQTNEGDTFPLKFEEGRRTLGSEVLEASRVISAMVETPMTEKIEQKVILADVDCGTLSNFLSYVERKRLIVNTVEEACNLYEMADKYAVMNLMRDCGSYLAHNLNSDNMIEISFLADIHNDDTLFHECNKCLKQNISIENVHEIFNLAKNRCAHELLTSVGEFVSENRNTLLERGHESIVHWLDERDREVETVVVEDRILGDDTAPESLNSLEPPISGQFEFYR